MTAAATRDSDTITVHVPLAFRKRGGRKQVIVPDGAPAWLPVRARIDSAMIKAVVRAFRWRDMLESGAYATIREIAAAEKITESYVSRVLRLTLLAPDIVEAILNGRQPAGLQLDGLTRRFPVPWDDQRCEFGLVPCEAEIPPSRSVGTSPNDPFVQFSTKK